MKYLKNEDRTRVTYCKDPLTTYKPLSRLTFRWKWTRMEGFLRGRRWQPAPWTWEITRSNIRVWLNAVKCTHHDPPLQGKDTWLIVLWERKRKRWTQVGNSSVNVAWSHIYHFLLAAGHSAWQKAVNVNALVVYCFAIFLLLKEFVQTAKIIFCFRSDV